MTKVYSEIPPLSENFRFGMTKVYSEIPPPHFRKLQIWDDQSLLRNTPPNFGKLQIWDDQSLLQNTPPPEFRNAESYYMWRLYPTGITTRCLCLLTRFFSLLFLNNMYNVVNRVLLIS